MFNFVFDNGRGPQIFWLAARAHYANALPPRRRCTMTNRKMDVFWQFYLAVVGLVTNVEPVKKDR